MKNTALLIVLTMLFITLPSPGIAQDNLFNDLGDSDFSNTFNTFFNEIYSFHVINLNVIFGLSLRPDLSMELGRNEESSPFINQQRLWVFPSPNNETMEISADDVVEGFFQVPRIFMLVIRF